MQNQGPNWKNLERPTGKIPKNGCRMFLSENVIFDQRIKLQIC